MIYKPFLGMNISQLGMGNMRLPTVGQGGPINEPAAQAIIDRAIASGINYFDTAYRYHKGQSELFIGKALKKYPRESWHLASKMPGHMMRYENGKLSFVGYLEGEKERSIAEIFEEQLERCGVDYFDFYLLHNVNETSVELYTNEELGVVDYLMEQKRKGRIRHLGFSSHGTAQTIRRMLDWRDCFEFVQIQLNYLDWDVQQAKEKYELLTERGIPVVVMEPCRGGRLAALDEAAAASLRQARPDATLASWAFRFVQSLPNVAVVLSGMTSMEQLEDNLRTFDRFEPMTPSEYALLESAKKALMNQIPCTGCRYCCEECPQNIEIPALLALYNKLAYDPGTAMEELKLRRAQLEACVGCGSCQRLCPQGIPVPELLEKLRVRLDQAQ